MRVNPLIRSLEDVVLGNPPECRECGGYAVLTDILGDYCLDHVEQCSDCQQFFSMLPVETIYGGRLCQSCCGRHETFGMCEKCFNFGEYSDMTRDEEGVPYCSDCFQTVVLNCA